MKFKKFVSSLTSFVLAGSLIASNAVFASAEEEFNVWVIIGADANSTSDWGYCYWGEGAADNKGNITSKGATITDNGTATVSLELESAAGVVYVTNPCIDLDSSKHSKAIFEVTECKVDGNPVDVDLTVKGNQICWFEQTGDKNVMRGAGFNEYGDKYISGDDLDGLTTIEFTVRLDLDGDGFEGTTDVPDEPAATPDEPEEEPAEPETDDSTSDSVSKDSNIPTVSFDGANWKNYVKLTPDASLAGLVLDQTTTDSYQATTLVVSASMPSALKDKWPAYASTVLDEDGNPLYKDAYDAAEKEVEGAFVRMGFELNAADFGLESFNGCTIEFYHLFNEAAYNALLNNAMYIYPITDLYEVATNTMPKTLKVDTLTRENVDFYKKDFIAIAPQLEGQEPATKVMFELPFMSGYEGEVFRMDNIKVILPDGESVIANVDSYNSTFVPRNESDGKIKPGSAQVVENEDESTTKKTEKKDDDKGGFNPIIILVVVLVIGAIALVVVILLKNKNRYY